MDKRGSIFKIEVSPPKQSAGNLRGRLERFAERYGRVVGAGYCACFTDNAMGHLAFQGCELLRELSLSAPAGQVMAHLNTFHSLADLHWILDFYGGLGVRDLLVVSGDGATRLPKLRPADVGGRGASVTSVELLAYIRKLHGDYFNLGVAFNQYEPEAHELAKTRRKIDAGAAFAITQPCLGENRVVDNLLEWLPIPLVIEAWMSPKVQLLTDCIGYDPGVAGTFDPMVELRGIRGKYPDCGVYLALLDFKTQFDELAARPAAA